MCVRPKTAGHKNRNNFNFLGIILLMYRFLMLLISNPIPFSISTYFFTVECSGTQQNNLKSM